MAQFQKGQPRPANGGRKKGSLNKKKIPSVADFLAQKDINPAEEILKILRADYDLKDKEKIDAWRDLLSYCQAKPSTYVECESEDSGDELGQALEAASTATLLQIVKDYEKGT